MIGITAHSSRHTTSSLGVASVTIRAGKCALRMLAWSTYNLRSRCLAAQMVAPEFILTLRIMSDSDWYPIGTVPAGEALGTSSRGAPAPSLVTQRVWFSVK